MSITSITHSVSGRVAAGAVGFAMAISLLGAAAPASAAALTSAQVQAIVSLLQSFGADQTTIANVQASLNGQPTTGGGSTGGSTSCSASFTRDLTTGSTGSDVMALQQFLNSHGAVVASSGAGSPGSESSYFGSLTTKALAKYQAAQGISPAAGYFGPLTRANVNGMCTGTGNPGNPGTPTGPGITVSAASQPANSLAVESASRVPFTTFTLTNNTGAPVTVNSVTVQRTGFANDAVFSGIVLLDSNGLQIGVSSTLNSNHQSTIGSPFTLNAGQSMTYSIAGNMIADLSSYAGQIASLQVVAVNTSVPVNGSLPISGAQQTINASLVIGTAVASVSSFDPNNATTRNIGDTDINFSGVRLQAGSAEDIKLYSIRWRMNGSASSADLGNLMTYVNGTSYPATLSSDGRYVTSSFPGGILIPKGISTDVYVRGNIIGSNASGRVAEFDIDKAADIYVVGQTYGYGIIPTANTSGSLSTASTHASIFSTSQPFFQGSTVSIQGGTVTTITNASSVSSQNIAVNVPNQILGGFQTNFLGEPVTVQTMVFHVATTSNTATNLTNVSIVDQNGAVVAGPVDSVYSSSGDSTLTFGNSVTFPVGTATYTLKGTVPTTAVNGDTYRLNVTPSSWTNVTGQTTGNTVSLASAGQIFMNTMTVRGATLSISLSGTPAAQSIVAGGQNVVFANVQLDASQSGEDVRINSLPLSLGTNATTPATVAGSTTTNLSACQLWNGNVGSGTALNYGSNIVNTPTVAATTSVTTVTSTSNSTNFAFNNSLVIPKGSVVTLTLTCNVASGSTGAYGWNIVNGAGTVTATGNTSNTSLSSSALTVTTVAAGAQTVSDGSFTVAVDSATTPSRTMVAGGTSGVTIGTVKFIASNEPVSLTKVGLSLVGGTYGTNSTAAGASSNNGVNDVITAYIYDGSNRVGSVTFTNGTTQSATSTLTTAVSLVQNSAKILTIKADVANVGIGQNGGIGDVVAIKPLNAEGIGLSSGSTLQVSGTGTVGGVQLFKSYPNVAAVSSASAGISGANAVLKKFTVTSNAAGPIGLSRLSFTLATSSASAKSIKLYAYTDAGYSQGVSNQGSGTGLVGTQCASGCTTAQSAGTAAVIFDASSPIQVSGTVYFALLANVTQDTTGSNGTVFATLVGDSADPGVGASPSYIATSTAAIIAGSNDNFIWSGNSSTTAATTDVDWWNGYFVPGLPSTGL